MSAQKAERIYDAKKVLKGNRDYLGRLESEQIMDGILGVPSKEDLESRISAARSRLDEQKAEIERMESDYQDWLRDNA